MTIIDLTHPWQEGMSLFPGTTPPAYSLLSTLEREGFQVTTLRFSSHTGTHVDAPRHVLPGAPTLDQLPLERFWGRAVLADTGRVSGEEIEQGLLSPLARKLEEADFLLIKTGWSSRWGREEYQTGFPVPSREAAEWLLQFGLKGIGIDALSIDPTDSRDIPNHRLFLDRSWLVVENLELTPPLPTSGFWFGCFPLPYPEADGSPVRAVALLP